MTGAKILAKTTVMKLVNESVIQKTKNVHWKAVNGEAVLMNIVSGDYFSLDEVGTHLWSQITSGPVQFNHLIESLTNEYTISRDQAEGDAKDFCGQLLAEKLVELKN